MKPALIHFFGTAAIVAIAWMPLARGSAPAGRFTPGTGTVYDTKTRLTWQQAVPATTYAWADAVTYCAALGASLGGMGWRLPTRKELMTIVDYSRSSPAIDPTVFPSTPSTDFWSSTLGSPTTAGGYTSNPWYVSFVTGAALAGNNPGTAAVRCVR